MKKRIATLEDHKLWGEHLHNIKNGLQSIWIDISNANGKSTVRPITNRLDKAIELISEARSMLEDKMCADWKEETRKLSDPDFFAFYYGHNSIKHDTISDAITKHRKECQDKIDQETRDKLIAKYSKKKYNQ